MNFLLSEEEFLRVLMSISKDKSPGNDGLTQDFYETFWEDLKTPLSSSFKSAFDQGKLGNSQLQAVIKLIEKEGKEQETCIVIKHRFKNSL